jgi:hypothetical protein
MGGWVNWGLEEVANCNFERVVVKPLDPPLWGRWHAERMTEGLVAVDFKRLTTPPALRATSPRGEEKMSTAPPLFALSF